MSKHDKPWVKAYYMTLDEYIDLVREVANEVYSFNDNPYHPEDLAIQLEVTSESVSKALGYLIRRSVDGEKNS